MQALFLRLSPDTTGFLPRPRDTVMPASPVGSPPPLGMASDRPPQLGELVALNLSRAVPGSDAPAMSLPVYHLPSGMMLMPVSCSAQTILAPDISSQQGLWSLAMPQDCPPVSTGLPGCPYRITSYTGGC